jgi:hypothetical protein
MSGSLHAHGRLVPPEPFPRATAILVPMNLRALWLDNVALDKQIDNASLRFAAVIGAHLNRRTGNAYLTVESIARLMGMSERTAYHCSKILERLGYLIVKRREFGTITRKTDKGEFQVRTAGGKGLANTYLPALGGAQVATTSGSPNLTARRDLLLKLSTEKPRPKVAVHYKHSSEQSSQSPASKIAAHCDPTLPPSSKENSSRAREPSSASALGPLAAIIIHEIGEDKFRSWFGPAIIESDTPNSLTISFPTRFRAVEVRKRYGDKLVRWVQMLDRRKDSVELIVRD